MDNEKIFSSKKDLLNFLAIRESFLYPSFSKKYFEKEIPKKSNGLRKIRPPRSSLKRIQKFVLKNILSKCSQLPCVFGLSRGKSIVDNAKVHQKNFMNKLVNLDIQDFFPNITKKQVLKVFQDIGFNKENASILTKICTVDNYLPQGAPTSPCLASLVCVKMDKEIYQFCKKRNLEYSRYFDDISISGEDISNENIQRIENIIQKHNFSCNAEKKKTYDSGKNKYINGVLITESGLSVTDVYKSEIEEAFEISQTEKSKRVFIGKYGFYLYVNKDEATKFLKKLRN